MLGENEPHPLGVEEIPDFQTLPFLGLRSGSGYVNEALCKGMPPWGIITRHSVHTYAGTHFLNIELLQLDRDQNFEP